MKRLAYSLLLPVLIVTGCSQKEDIPQPTGKYAVGTAYYKFTDTSREESFTDTEGDFRTVTAKVWYPAVDDPDKESSTILIEPKGDYAALNLPEYYLDVRVSAKLELEANEADAPYPLLIFNHGWGEHFAQNTFLMEELASHGYVVFSISHHYENWFSIYPDSTYFAFDMQDPGNRFRTILKEQSNPDAGVLFRRLFAAESDSVREDVFSESTELMPLFLKGSPGLWAEDISFVIDKTAEINEYGNELLKGIIDTSEIGVFGMSMGGIASISASINDPRIDAVINIDGGLYGSVLDTVVTDPVMYINSVRYQGYQNLFFKYSESDAHVVTIPEADHYNFHEISYFEPEHEMTGTIDKRRMIDILNDFVRTFFDAYLLDMDKGLEKSGSKYPETEYFRKKK